MLEPSIFGEMKGRRLTFAIRQLCKSEFYGNILKASKMMLLEVWHGLHFYEAIFWQCQMPSLHVTKIRGSNITLNIAKYQMQGRTPHQNMSSLGEFEVESNV